MNITANQVKELRERTGAGMMECKKALQASGGDMEAAIEAMRISGQAKAVKKAGRIAAEGIISSLLSTDGKEGILIEINCETDFVARDENFIAFAKDVTATALQNKVSVVANLMSLPNPSQPQETLEQARESLISKIGENINVRRVHYLAADNGVVGCYLHGTRIGVLVQLEHGDANLAKDIAMHIAASNPVVINPQDVSADLIAKEREIFIAQAESSGKPKEIIEKMVEGRIKKYQEEVSLLSQPFVKDPSLTIAKLLQDKQAKVINFIRFEVGEGIDKPQVNFAEEVMAQVKES